MITYVIPLHFYSCHFDNHLIMYEPVICDDGYIYEKELIENYLKNNKNMSPITKQIINTIIPNKVLSNEISDFIKNKSEFLTKQYLPKYLLNNIDYNNHNKNDNFKTTLNNNNNKNNNDNINNNSNDNRNDSNRNEFFYELLNNVKKENIELRHMIFNVSQRLEKIEYNKKLYLLHDNVKNIFNYKKYTFIDMTNIIHLYNDNFDLIKTFDLKSCDIFEKNNSIYVVINDANILCDLIFDDSNLKIYCISNKYSIDNKNITNKYNKYNKDEIINICNLYCNIVTTGKDEDKIIMAKFYNNDVLIDVLCFKDLYWLELTSNVFYIGNKTHGKIYHIC